MVDYSRFAGIGEDEEDEQPRRPQVTRLDRASTVTITPGGVHVQPEAAAAAPVRAVDAGRAPKAAPQLTSQQRAPPAAAQRPAGTLDYSKWDAFRECVPGPLPVPAGTVCADALPPAVSHPLSSEDSDYEYEEEAPEYEEDVIARARHAPPPPGAGVEAPPLAEAAAACPSAPPLRATFTRNGGCVKGQYLWSQSATEVVLSVLAPAGARAKDVRVWLHRSSQDDSTSLLHVSHAGKTLLEGRLAHGVEAEAGEEGEKSTPDWELVDFEDGRAVRVTLRKSVPGASMVLWWRSALQGGPQVDTEAFEDRQHTAARTATARKVWQEAEAMFLDSVRNRQQIEIPLDDEEGGDEEAPHAAGEQTSA